MKNFEIKKILIPIDFSETAALALEHGVFMAKLMKAEITFMHVFEAMTFVSALDYSVHNIGIEHESNMERAAREELEKIANEVRARSSVTTETRIEVGRAHSRIVEVAKEIDADIIVMGTHGVSGFSEFLMGSNAFRVANTAPCPVLSVQMKATKLGFSNIALPIDNTPHTRQKLKHAVELAKHYGSTLHLVGIISEDEPGFEGRFMIKLNQAVDFIKSHDVPYTMKTIKGDKIPEIVIQFADEVNADLVAIMTEQEASFSTLIMGPYAQQMVNHCKVPMLSIRPEIGNISNEFSFK
jgi:nucleotide-binding universal stress UspA family protein